MFANLKKKNILRSFGNLFSRPLISFLCKSLRIEEVNKQSVISLKENRQNLVFIFWHGKMLVPWFTLRKYKPSTIISKSKDGNLLSNILTSWKYKVLRGSSSKGGKEVLELLIKSAKEKKDIVITPDGPRGPAKCMKAGAVIVAKKTGIPIILIGVNYYRKKILHSWDKFEIPYFFSKVKIAYSNPIYVNENLNYEETDLMIKRVEKELQNIDDGVV